MSGIFENNVISQAMIKICIHSKLCTRKKFLVSCAVLESITCKLQTLILVDDLQIAEEIITTRVLIWAS